MIPDITLFGSTKLVDLLIAIGVFVGALVIAKMVTLNLRRSLQEKVSAEHLEIVIKVVNYGLIIVAILWILAIFKVNPSGLLVAGGIAGIVIGFASQSIVGNLISGVFLMLERPVKIGNQVNIEGHTGFVEDITIVATIIRTYDGLYIRVPNEKVFTSSITNYVGNVARRFEYVVGIRYSDDADRAVSIIKGLVEKQPFALKNPASQVFVQALGDNSVNIMVRIWAPVSEWYTLNMKLLWKIKKTLEEDGIEIAFPQRVVWFGDRPPGPAKNNPEGDVPA